MLHRFTFALLLAVFWPHACSGPGKADNVSLKYKAKQGTPQVLAVYEAWFGHPRHISVGYSSHDSDTLNNQILKAKSMGINGFVIDWYGDREPFIDQSYALMQKLAAKNNFKVAMMYDETSVEDGATDEAIADFTMFRDTYLSSPSGRQAYLTYDGRPVIFVFPKGLHTDWDKVKQVLNTWNPAPLLIQENLPAKYTDAFDGFYAWINPGPKGYAADGSNWGADHLSHFYSTMLSQHPDKMIVGGAWANFDDKKAAWSLNRHISARCGQTLTDTFNYWRKVLPANDPPPFILVETWNDYEEGTAIEPGIPSCGKPSVNPLLAGAPQGAATSSGRE